MDSPDDVAKVCVPELVCEVCGQYPIEPVHGHFVCPACKNITKCCEGMPVAQE